jgi:hypothetical protein
LAAFGAAEERSSLLLLPGSGAKKSGHCHTVDEFEEWLIDPASVHKVSLLYKIAAL